ncbi:hypothetical protein [Caballeronia glebae]|uniref:hypothetical protein n=1 Tax=Caballeronia glebae TaxID=1777143 RepID=UPI0038BB7308
MTEREHFEQVFAESIAWLDAETIETMWGVWQKARAANDAAGASEGQAKPRQTVPRKLTLRMVGAFQEYWKHTQNIYGAWAAMLDAAPKMPDPSAELAALRERIAGMEKDAQRLDSGCIVTTDYDEFGDQYMTERRGYDLRAAIDAAIAKEPLCAN